MRLLVFLVIQSLAGVLLAQDTLYFTPKWKRGDKKKVRISYFEKTYEKDVLVSDTNYFYNAKYHVREEDDSSYLMYIKVPNIAMKSVVKAFEKLENNYKGYRDLELLYRFMKKDGSYKLTNFAEVKSYLQGSVKDLEELITEKLPDQKQVVDALLKPVNLIVKDEASVTAYVDDYIHIIQYPFGKNFIMGDTLRIITKGENPLNPGDSASQTDLYIINKGSYLNYDITHQIVIDTDDFKRMMVSVMNTMQEGLELDSSNHEANITALNFDMQSQITVDFNSATSWPNYARQVSKVIAGKKIVRTVVNYTLE